MTIFMVCVVAPESSEGVLDHLTLPPTGELGNRPGTILDESHPSFTFSGQILSFFGGLNPDLSSGNLVFLEELFAQSFDGKCLSDPLLASLSHFGCQGRIGK